MVLLALPLARAYSQVGGASDTVSTVTQTPAIPSVSNTALGGNVVLLVQDSFPWGADRFDWAFTALRIPYDRIGSASLATADLSGYRLICLASAQGANFYSSLNANRAKLEAWLNTGGVLQASLASMGAEADGCTLPGGVSSALAYDGSNAVLSLTHPITQGLPATLVGNVASHRNLTNLPAAAIPLVGSVTQREARTMATYKVGSGTVVVSGMTEQYHYGVSGSNMSDLFARMMRYSLSIGGYVVTASAGPGGSISPSGDVAVAMGTSQSFVITPGAGARIRDVRVDGVSVGPVPSYTFSSVGANHTIAASFDVNRIDARSPGGILSCESRKARIPVILQLSGSPTLAGFSVGFELHGLTTSSADIQLGRAVGASGASVSMIVLNQGAGRYTVDATTLGAPCGFSVTNDTLFTLDVGSEPAASGIPNGVGGVVLTSVQLRDCANVSIPVSIVDSASVLIIRGAPPATSLVATQTRTGNGSDGTTSIGLSWNSVPAERTVEIWRRGYGNYPEYDDGPSPGAVPGAPSSYPPIGWTKTTVTASGQADRPNTRDIWYYVAFVKDACGTVSVASNVTGGTLNYHLGDFSNGIQAGAGDNLVNTADMSLLGANYGKSGAAVDAVNYLDIGPTVDRSVNARPTTDNVIGFEDFILLGLNYSPVVSGPAAHARPAAAEADVVTLDAPASVVPGAEVAVRLGYAGTGRMQGVSVALSWDPSVVEPVGQKAGDGLAAQEVVLLSGAPGSVDAVSFAGAGNGLVGEGALATIRFRVKSAGAPRIEMASVEARDRQNQAFSPSATLSTPVGKPHSWTTAFAVVRPNPFTDRTRFEYTLARAGRAELLVFSVDGRRVRSLVSGVLEAGAHRTEWDGRDDAGRTVSEGTYFAKLKTAAGEFTRRVTLLK